MKLFTHAIATVALIVTTVSMPKIHVHVNTTHKSATEFNEETQKRVNKELLEATKYNNSTSIKHALQNGADINTADEFGFTPLHYAIRNGDRDLIILFLNNGANVNAKNIYGITPLLAAAIVFNPELISILLTYTNADVHAIDVYGRNALLCVAEHACPAQVAEKLIAAGCDTNIQNNRGNTPLHYAVKYGQFRLAQTLLKKGATPNTANKKGITPLMKAAQNDHAQEVQLLLENGADVYAQDNDGFTALMHTLINEKEIDKPYQIEIIQMLLDKKAPVNAVSIYGETALFFAGFQNNVEAIKLLLAAGGNPLIAHHTGHMAMDAIVRHMGKKIFEKLINHQ